MAAAQLKTKLPNDQRWDGFEFAAETEVPENKNIWLLRSNTPFLSVFVAKSLAERGNDKDCFIRNPFRNPLRR